MPKILDQMQAAVPPRKHEFADLVRDFRETTSGDRVSFDAAYADEKCANNR